jgi:hypothetical protein
MNRIVLLRSACAVNEAYEEAINKRLKALGLSLEVKTSQDPDLWAAYGVSSRCMMGYCPGCNFHEGMDGAFLPALVINGRLVFHSRFPSDQELDRAILEGIE